MELAERRVAEMPELSCNYGQKDLILGRVERWWLRLLREMISLHS